MFAVIVNTIAIIVGTLIGLLIRRGISDRLTQAVMQALGLCTVIIGVHGAIQTNNILIMIISVAVGVGIGEYFDIDKKINSSTERLLNRFVKNRNQDAQSKKSEGTSAQKITEAFITSCLIMNVGAMVIVGSLDAGLSENYTMLYTKSLLDFISGIMLGAIMGIGVLGSAAFTLIFQGAIVLCAQLIAPFMSDLLISELSVTGCALILAIGLNMLKITSLKVLNYIPALLIVPLAIKIVDVFGIS